jgi:hypothetical protein
VESGARGRRRRRRRRITATTAVVVVLAAAVGLGVWRMQSDGSTPRPAKAVSVTRDPSRFEMRPVLAVGNAPCAPGLFPGRTQPGGATTACYMLGAVVIDARDVAIATISSTPQDGVGIDLNLTPAGLEKLNALAGSGYARPSPQNQVAFVVDGTIESAPQLNTSHFDNEGVRISGNFTDAEARRVLDIIVPPSSGRKAGRLSVTDAIANPCRVLTLTDAQNLLGSTAVSESDGPHGSGGCTYSSTPRSPVSGIAVDASAHSSLSVQLWRGQLGLDTSTSTTCPDCIPQTVRTIAGIGDRAAWYQLVPFYQTGAFPDGNLDVQVGGTAIRITVAATENAEAVAETAARVVVPRLAG